MRNILIGVELPLTTENIYKLDGHELMQAHEMFLINVILERQRGSLMISENMNQFSVCKQEMIKRLTK